MNINIQTLQSGGGVLPPLTYYRPVMVNNQQPVQYQSNSQYSSGPSTKSNQSAKSEEKDEGFKEINDLFKEINALPSDLDNLSSQLQQFAQLKSMGLDSSVLARQYVQLLMNVKKADFNRKEYDNAYTNIAKRNNLDTPVILQDGSLLVTEIGKKEPITMSVDNYLQNQDKYKFLTNQELLQMRAEFYPNNNNILSIASHGISIQDVKTYLESLVSKFGSNSVEQDSHEGRHSKKIITALDLIEKAYDDNELDVESTTLNGMFKRTKTTVDQKQQMKQALEYMYDMLPSNMRSLLKLNSEGKDPKIIIAELLNARSSSSVKDKEFLLEKENGLKPGAKGKSSSTDADGNDESKLTVDKFSQMVSGTGGTNSSYRIMNKDGYSLSVKGLSYGNPGLKGGDLKEGSLQNLLDYGYGNFTPGDDYAITFGDQILSSKDFDQIAFLNDRSTTRVILPVKEENGKYVPDLDLIERHQDKIDIINNKQGNLNDPEVKKAMEELGLYNPVTGLPEQSRLQVYICVNGLATDRNIKNTSFVELVKGDDLDPLVSKFENAVHQSKSENGSGVEYDFDFDKDSFWPGDWFGLHDNLYKGTIFIPITANVNQAKTASGTTYKQDYQDAYEEDYQMGELRRYANPTNSSLLFE